MIRFWFLVTFLAFCLSSQAQHPYAWDLTDKDGLPSLEVYDLFQDSKGYMWIGTDKGLCKYNGTEFSYYKNAKEKGQALSGIKEDKEGRIWVRNFKNQIFYVAGDSMYYFNPLDNINANGISDFFISSKGDIWIIKQTTDSLYAYINETKEWKRWGIDVENKSKDNLYKVFFSITENSKKEIILGSLYGLYKVKGEKLVFLTQDGLLKKENLEGNRASVEVFPMILTKRNQDLLICQFFSNVSRYSLFDGEKITPIENTTHQEYFKYKQSHSFRVLADGSVWQLSHKGGIGLVASFGSYGSLDSTLLLFPQEGISDIVKDHEGNYWISSLKNGIHIIPNMKIQHFFSHNSILGKSLIGQLEKTEDNQLLIAIEGKEVLKYDAEKHEFSHRYKVPKLRVNTLYCEKKKVHIGGDGFHYLYNKGDSLENQKFPEGSNIKNCQVYNDTIIIANSGYSMFIIKVKDGMYLDNISSSFFPSIPISTTWNKKENRKITSRVVTSKKCNWILANPEQKRILVAWEDSLICYTEDGRTFPILDEHKNLILGNKIFKADNGTIWVTTANQGIYGFDKDLNLKYHFTMKEGLLSNFVLSVSFDEENLWMLTGQGIQFLNPKTKEKRNYTTHDGLPTHEIKDIAVVNGKVWLSTIEGLVAFEKDIFSKNYMCPPVFISQVAIHEKKQEVLPSYYLEYTQDALAISVEGISFRSRGKFYYMYRMLGIDSNWTKQPSAVNIMRFPQLSPGTYFFEVKTVNEDAIESSSAARIMFVIKPPYWQTWWFQGLIYLSGMLIVAILVLTRTRVKQKQQEQEQEFRRLKMDAMQFQMNALQSQMNPHFIFNVLTAIQNLWLQNKIEAAMNMQSSFAKLLRKIFQYSSKTAIPIEQLADFLKNYLNLEQIRFEHKVWIDFEIEEELLEEDYYIPPLLIQPILENSFKHGLFHLKEDKKLSINLKKEGPYLYCCIIDNGVGRKPQKVDGTKRSSGLSTTIERLKILQRSIIKTPHPHQNLKITDLLHPDNSPKGTQVELWIPFVDL